MIATMQVPKTTLPNVLQPESSISEFDGYKELAAEFLEGAVEDWVDPSRSPHSKNEFQPSRPDILDFLYSERFALFVACLDGLEDIEVVRKSFKRRLLGLLKTEDRNRLVCEYYDTGRSYGQLAQMFQMTREAIRSVIRRDSNGK